MNRIYLFLFAFLLFLIFQIPIVQDKVVMVSNFFKENIENITNNVKEKIRFFEEKEKEINYLKKENLNLQKKLAEYEAFFEDCKALKKFKFLKDKDLKFVKVISYASLPDFTKIYITYKGKISAPLGLVYNNLAAGVVIKNFGAYSLALLNSNEKASYAVMIGDKEIPGIFKGKINTVKYIEKFAPIKVGDIVKTSGLDGIFYKGALVGKVIKIEQKKLYQEAKIKLFYSKNTPDYFYVVEKNVTIKK
jgi:rod shape-determining protein MreC